MRKGVINLHLSNRCRQLSSELQHDLTEYQRPNTEITSFAGTHGGDKAEEWRSWLEHNIRNGDDLDSWTQIDLTHDLTYWNKLWTAHLCGLETSERQFTITLKTIKAEMKKMPLTVLIGQLSWPYQPPPQSWSTHGDQQPVVLIKWQKSTQLLEVNWP